MTDAEAARIVREGEARLREARTDPAASALWAWLQSRKASR